MKKRIFKTAIVLCICILLFWSQSIAEKKFQDVDWRGFDEFVKQSMKQWKVPGLALAVVAGEDVIYSLCAGLRDIKNNLPVTPDTAFAIGSTSKAFTAALIGILVDDGKIDWDTPVIRYLPSLRLKDPLANERLTPRDLLCHRSGLPDHTLSWYARVSTREELIARLQHLKPTADFRNAYQYNNYMITTAGYLAGRVTGSTWEELIRQRIFQPLEMENSGFTGSIQSIRGEKNMAIPYSIRTGTIQEIPLSPAYEAVGPAGNIISTVEDMTNWLKLHMNNGTFKGKQIISETTMKEMHSPQMIVSETSMYGLAWAMDFEGGKKRVYHGGALEGYYALVIFIPEEKIGMVILTNLHLTLLPTVIAYTAYDRLFGRDEKDWNKIFKDSEQRTAMLAAKASEKWKKMRKLGTRFSHSLKDYTGKYENPGYGVLSIKLEQDTLRASFNGTVSFDLKHFHYDVFTTSNISAPGREYAFPYFSAAKLMFKTDLKGAVSQVAFITDPNAGKEVELIFSRK